MYKGTKAYIFKDDTVVLNKKDIKNSKDEEYKEVIIYIPYKFIIESYDEIVNMLDEEEIEEIIGE